VTAFAEKEVDRLDLRLGQVGKKPAQQRFKQDGRAVIRIGITGCGKNHEHPEQRQEPGFCQSVKLLHTR